MYINMERGEYEAISRHNESKMNIADISNLRLDLEKAEVRILQH